MYIGTHLPQGSSTEATYLEGHHWLVLELKPERQASDLTHIWGPAGSSPGMGPEAPSSQSPSAPEQSTVAPGEEL